MDCLVSGYINRELLNGGDYHYPESLTAIFIQFLGNILFKFDLFHAMHQGFIQNDGTTFNPIGYFDFDDESFCVGSSYRFNTGIYNVVIKWSASDEPDLATDNPIGICSDIACCQRKGDWIFKNDEIYAYAVYSVNLVQSEACNKYGSNGTQCSVYPWENKKEEEFSLIIDCNQWTLTFFTDNKQLGHAVNIAKDTEYHLFINVQSDKGKYEIISCVHQK